MSLPKEIQSKLEEALDAVKSDIEVRRQQQESFEDLTKIENELLEMKAGTRKMSSDEVSRMIIDSMDWNQPCLKSFNEVRQLLRMHYKLR